MAMPALPIPWTVDMLDGLPDDGQRYEIIDGELFVTPAPSDVHQFVVLAVGARLHRYMRAESAGRALCSPADVRRDDQRRNRVQPDVLVVRLVEGRVPPYPYQLSDLLLAVEVKSPGNPDYDFHTKRRLYLNAGVPEYWIVDPETRTIARWRDTADSGELFAERIEWQPSGMPEPFRLDLGEFFEDALG
jgi:Uma2 family endonuclease